MSETYKVEDLESNSFVSHKITAEDKNGKTYQYKAFFDHLIFLDENVYGRPTFSKFKVKFKNNYLKKSDVHEKITPLLDLGTGKHYLLIKNGGINTFKEQKEDYRYELAKNNRRNNIEALTNNFFNLLFKPLEEKLLQMYEDMKQDEK